MHFVFFASKTLALVEGGQAYQLDADEAQERRMVLMISTRDVEKILRQHRETNARIKILEMLLEKRERGYLSDLSTSVEPAVEECSIEGEEIGELSLLSADAACEQLGQLRSQTRLVDAWLTMLSPEERFILETHTIGGLDWARTIIEHERKWGREQGRSDRTLKRIQAKAIRKIWLATNVWLYGEDSK